MPEYLESTKVVTNNVAAYIGGIYFCLPNKGKYSTKFRLKKEKCLKMYNYPYISFSTVELKIDKAINNSE